jgi:hypothetical protein
MKLMIEAPPVRRVRYYLGLDLGQNGEYSALAIVRRINPDSWHPETAVRDKDEHCRYECVALKRYDLGASYPSVVADIGALLKEESLDFEDTTLVIDETAVGKPIVDLFRSQKLKPLAVTLTGGYVTNKVDRFTYHIPKRDLVSSVQALLQSERLKIANRLPHAETLQRELLSFKFKVTLSAGDDLLSWREGAADDLVFALCLACWTGENLVKYYCRAY